MVSLLFLSLGLRCLVMLRDVTPWQQTVRVQAAVPRKRGPEDHKIPSSRYLDVPGKPGDGSASG